MLHNTLNWSTIHTLLCFNRHESVNLALFCVCRPNKKWNSVPLSGTFIRASESFHGSGGQRWGWRGPLGWSLYKQVRKEVSEACWPTITLLLSYLICLPLFPRPCLTWKCSIQLSKLCLRTKLKLWSLLNNHQDHLKSHLATTENTLATAQVTP